MTGSTTPCREKPDIQGYLDNLLTLPERHRFERHVKDCRTCNQALDHYRRLFTAMDEACAPSAGDAPSSGRVEQTMKRLPTGKRLAGAPEPFFAVFPKGWALALAGCCMVFLFTSALFFVSRNRPETLSTGLESSSAPLGAGVADLPRYEYSFLAAPDKPGSVVKSDAPIPAQGTLQPGAAYRLPEAGTLFVSFAGSNRLEFSRGAQFSAVASGVTLLSGQVLCDLQPQANGFTVSTPAGSVAVRGTRFTVAVSPRGTEVRLDRGSVELQTPRARERLMNPGSRLLTPDGAIVSPAAHPGTDPATVQQPTVVRPTPPDPGNSAGNLNQGF